jgi:hypothetical protein
VDGSKKVAIEQFISNSDLPNAGSMLAAAILQQGGQAILDELHAHEK